MSYCLPTPGRAHHLRNLHISRASFQEDNLNDNRKHDDSFSRPAESASHFSQPDDRGILVAMGTSRLPLGRHACGKLLWSFLDALGETGTSPYDVMKRASLANKSLWEFFARCLSPWLKSATDNIADHSFADDRIFKERYSLMLYDISKFNITGTLFEIVMIYDLLEVLKHARPAGLGQGNWLIELQMKREAHWVCRWDQQWWTALATFSVGIGLARKREYWDAMWYFVRAIMDLAPWYPSEWFLASWEAELPEVQLYMNIVSSLADCLYRVKQYPLAHALATTLVETPLSSGPARRRALTIICQCLAGPQTPSRIPWHGTRLVQRRDQTDLLPFRQWDEYNELISTKPIFSAEDVASRSFAQDFTPANAVSFIDRCPHMLQGGGIDVLDKAKTSLRNSYLACAYGSWRKDPSKPYCWSILEEHEELDSGELGDQGCLYS